MDHSSLVAPAPTEGHGPWSCDQHVDGFRQWLAGLGYRPRTIKAKVQVVGALVWWMREERVPLGDLEEGRATAFVATRRRRQTASARDRHRHRSGTRQSSFPLASVATMQATPS